MEPCSPPLQPGGPELVSIFKTSLWAAEERREGVKAGSNRRWALSAPALSEEGRAGWGGKQNLPSERALRPGGWL